MKKTLSLGLVCLSCSLPLIAGTMSDISTLSPVYMGVYGGYGTIDGEIGQDGNFTQFRLSLGARGPWTYKNTQVGAELGVQWGNTMRLSVSEELSALNSYLPFSVTLKPIIDALITLKYQFQPNSPLDLLLKGGIAYRQMQFNDMTSPKDHLSKVNGEFQAGLSYHLSQHAEITAVYQGIYSSSNAGVRYTVSSTSGYYDTGYFTLSQIPTQQAGFLGIEYTF